MSLDDFLQGLRIDRDLVGAVSDQHMSIDASIFLTLQNDEQMRKCFLMTSVF